jgi:Fibronectin type-III domain
VKDAHPDWTPGQIKSALMTSSVQDVLKENGVTPSDPFDRGAGSIRANRAVAPTVTFDVTAAQYLASAADPLNRIHLNLPSINANPMPGVVTTTRTLKNVTDTNQVLKAEATAPAGASIDVEPGTIVVNPGETAVIRVTINATSLANGQYFGQITLDPNKGGYNNVVLPVAFRKAQGQNSLVHSCTPTTIPVGGTSDCLVEAQNLAPVQAQASLDVSGPQNRQLTIQNVSAPGVPKGAGGNGFTWSGTLTPALAPTIDNLLVPAAPPPPVDEYLPLRLLGVTPISGVGDDTLVNFTVPAFTYGTEAYTRLAVTTNGYVVVGGGASQDLIFMPQTFPNIARPNNVLAPYWTDLDPTQGAPGSGVRIAVITDGVSNWIVVDWENVPVFTGGAQRSFQMWIGLAANTPAGDDITFLYGNNIGPGDSASGLNSGAENRDGTSGKNRIPASNDTVRVITSPPTPGGKVTITYDAFGRNAGTHDILATLTSNLVQGATTDRETITVTK